MIAISSQIYDYRLLSSRSQKVHDEDEYDDVTVNQMLAPKAHETDATQILNNLLKEYDKKLRPDIGNIEAMHVRQQAPMFGIPSCYLYPGSPLQPPGDFRNGVWNTRLPKRVPANLSFFALRIHSEATRPIVPEDNTDLNSSAADPRAPCRPQVLLVHK
ncbi:UNVERIFIED_CONTAM: hypothetical protein FKN15_077657 [Acipenser sinensis]